MRAGAEADSGLCGDFIFFFFWCPWLVFGGGPSRSSFTFSKKPNKSKKSKKRERGWTD